MSACSSKTPTSAVATPQQKQLTATIQELMLGKIDPAADALWDSVAFIESPSGTEDRRPRTDSEWRAVRTHAISLVEAAKLLRVPGRRVKSGNSAAGHGELSSAEIQERIDTNQDGFVGFAGLLQDAGLKALTAIDARNAQALMDAGGVIDEACEACHATYWYPNQNRRGT
jgi:cytochrome c556